MSVDFIEQQWIPALRSGEYKQGQGMLRSETNFFCCLGVACDCLNPNGWVMSPKEKGTTPVNFYVFEDGNGGALTTDGVARVGLAEIGVFQGELIGMNDNGTSFAEIADFLEKKVEEYRAKHSVLAT